MLEEETDVPTEKNGSYFGEENSKYLDEVISALENGVVPVESVRNQVAALEG